MTDHQNSSAESDAVAMLWKLIRFYDEIDRDHADGEAKLLDEAAAVVAAAQVPAPAQPAPELLFCHWLKGYLGAIKGRDELTPAEANTIRGNLLQLLYASQPSPAATVETGRHISCAPGGKPYADSHERSSAGSEPVAWQVQDKHGRWISLPGDWSPSENVKGYAYRPLYTGEPQTLPVGPRELKPITMSDIRLMAGEGTLTPKDVLAAANAVLRMRQSSLLPRPHLARGE